MNIQTHINDAFFRPISARGFSHMRIAWAAVLLIAYGRELNSVEIFNDTLFIDPTFFLIVFLITLVGTMIGWHTRVMVISSTLILFVLHASNTSILGGGDTVMRLIGFLLCISPQISLISVDQLRRKNMSTTMPIWPWRLLLWQVIVIYGMSLWTKLLGDMWWSGDALIIALRNPDFALFPMIIDMPLLTLIGAWCVLIFEALWLLLLLPQPIVDLLPSFVRRYSLRRILMACGVVFHLFILLFFHVGLFSFAMLIAYVGLLRHRTTSATITILYDGQCGLCTRSMVLLNALDLCGKVHMVDFHDRTARTTHAPNITITELDRALHIRLPDHSYRTGFDAFRALCWHLPLLLPLAPLLYLPGISQLGRRIYAKIAAKRAKCTHTDCVASKTEKVLAKAS